MRGEADGLSGSDWAPLPARGEYRHGRDRLGDSAARPGARQNLDGRSGDCRRVDLLWTAERRVCRSGLADRGDVMAYANERANEGVAHDICDRRQAVRRGRGWPEYPLLRAVSVKATRAW